MKRLIGFIGILLSISSMLFMYVLIVLCWIGEINYIFIDKSSLFDQVELVVIPVFIVMSIYGLFLYGGDVGGTS